MQCAIPHTEGSRPPSRAAEGAEGVCRSQRQRPSPRGACYPQPPRPVHPVHHGTPILTCAREGETMCANACGKAEDATGAAISSRDADGAACMLFGAMRGYDAHAHPCATTMMQCWAAPSQGHGRPTQRRPVRHTTRHETTLRTCDGNMGSLRGSVGTGHLADQSATLLPQTSGPLTI